MIKVDLSQFTNKVEAWSGQVSGGLKTAAGSLRTSSEHYGPILSDSIKEKVKSSDGLPDKITFSFALHGIFWQMGVSKGYKIQDKGSGLVVKTNPGPFARQKVDWFNSPLLAKMDELTRIVAEENAALAAEGLAMGLSSLSIKGLD